MPAILLELGFITNPRDARLMNEQPELFADIDMIEEVKYYYSEFYEFELTDEQAQNVIDGWVIDDE